MLSTVAVAGLLLGAATPAAVPAKTMTPAELHQVVREMSAVVEQIRGLKFKTPVTMDIITPAAARKDMGSGIDEAVVEETRHTQNAYIQLGLVPAGTDLIGNYLAAAESDVLGYYDSRAKKLFLLSTVPADEVRGVVVHELTHALEDQHFDFSAQRSRLRGDDQFTAFKAVVEGSAMYVMLRYVASTRDRWAVQKAEARTAQRAQKVSGAPSFAQQTVMLPYLLGFSFVLKGRPWDFADAVLREELDAPYAAPPKGTRHIIHPEQYWGGRHRLAEAPSLPDLSPVLGPGWQKVTDGTLGELGLAVLTGSKLDASSIQALLPQKWTNEAANGTQGDVYHHYVNGTSKATALLTRWESMRDAEQFTAGLRFKGRYHLQLGANVLVLAGDIGDKGLPLATLAMQGKTYWADR
jgi:hypothetical protein